MCLQIKKLVLIDNAEDEENANVDAVVMVEESDENGRVETVKYLASFFTYRKIGDLTQQHRQNGEFLHGAYFHAPNMVLIDRCSAAQIRRVVDHLMKEGEFEGIFKRMD
jgi:hypothetical protein